MVNQIFSGREGPDFVLCSAFLCLSTLRSTEKFLHISDNTYARHLMHYFLSNAFDYSTMWHLLLAPPWQKIMVFYTVYLMSRDICLCVCLCWGIVGLDEWREGAGVFGIITVVWFCSFCCCFFFKIAFSNCLTWKSVSGIPDKICFSEPNPTSQSWIYTR